MVGLFIEMAGVWAVYTGWDDPGKMRVTIPGIARGWPVSWVVLWVGLVIWIVGVILVYRSAPAKRT
jgi:hypothetical protein